MESKKRPSPVYLRALFDKYKYILLLAAVGAALLLWPSGAPAEKAGETPEADAALLLAARLEELLAQVDGVGRVRVMLTARTGGETVYAFDESKTASRSEGSASSGSTTTLVTTGERGPVVVRTDAPVFSGALVVCDGADSARVRLALTEAVRSLTGVTADSIVIVKMK